MSDKPVVAGKSPIVEHVEPGTYYWCSCGKSSSQPYCDGSHKGTSFTPKEVVITEAQDVPWCACKHTKNPPYCDGSHSEV